MRLCNFFFRDSAAKERLIDLDIRSNLPRGLLTNSQHAYFSGRSRETALHEVVSFIEKGMNNMDYVVAAFLYIEGLLIMSTWN